MTDKDNLFARGEYFCTTADVWKVQSKQALPEHWAAFWRRETDVSLEVRGMDRAKFYDPYQRTLEAMKEGGEPTSIGGTRSDNTGNISVEDHVWPVDIIGAKAFDQPIAHLIPAGKVHHEEWFGVGAAVLGLPEDSTVAQQLMATRGVVIKGKENTPTTNTTGEAELAETSTEATNNKRKRKDDTETEIIPKSNSLKFEEESSTESKGSSTKFGKPGQTDPTGVVHFVTNKIRMYNQANALDGETPAMLIIPCMDLAGAKNWRGEGYAALVLTGFPDGLPSVPANYSRALDCHGTALAFAQQAFKDARMDTEQFQEQIDKREAINEDTAKLKLESARQGLEGAVLGLYEYVKGLKGEDLDALNKETRKRLEQRSQAFCSEGKVHVPSALKDELPAKPLLFLDFGDTKEEGTHPAPDPLILLAKAAVVWGKLTGITILANRHHGEEENEDYDSLDEVAENDFYKCFRASHVPKEISVTTPGISHA